MSAISGDASPIPYAAPSASDLIDTSGAKASAGARELRVSITVNTPPGGSDVPQSLQRSSRQIASAVRRAIGPY